jgi:hypothetical protein
VLDQLDALLEVMQDKPQCPQRSAPHQLTRSTGSQR